jgi:hypothetical protein
MKQFKHGKRFVYIIGDNAHNVFKIGKADSVKDRLKQLQTGNPFLTIRRVFMFESRNYADKAEKALHEIYSMCRFHGEWFRLSETELIRIGQRVKHFPGYCKTPIAEVIRLNTPIKKTIQPIAVDVFNSEESIVNFLES